MAGPFKLRSGNSPLFKMMGSSPVKQEKHFLEKKSEGPVVDKTVGKTVNEEIIKKDGKKKALREVLARQSEGKVKRESTVQENPKVYESKSKRVVEGFEEGIKKGIENVKKEEYKELKKDDGTKIKKKKGTWFGIGKDLGVTEAFSNVIDYLMPKR